MPYIPASYWERLHVRGDLSAVGQSGLPASLNAWLYRIHLRNLSAFLDEHGVQPNTVFDVGAGTGVFVDYWKARGALTVDGCDLVPAAVDELNRRHGGTGCFIEADIADRVTAPLEGGYDVVSCMNVLLHITDDDRFRQAVMNISRLVRPGGWLVMTEPILRNPLFEHAARPDLSSRARRLAKYRRPAEDSGLRLVDVRASTAIGNNPIEGASRPAYWAWRGLWAAFGAPCKVLPSTANWIGPVLWMFDPLALKLGAAPSGKLAIFQRPP